MREGVAGTAISDVGQLLRARYHNTSYAPTLFFFSSFRKAYLIEKAASIWTSIKGLPVGGPSNSNSH